MTERVSTYGLANTMLSSAMGLQSRFAQASAQNASGLKGNNYTDLDPGECGRLIAVENALNRTQTWSSNAQTVLSRVEAMYAAMGDMTDKLTNLRTTLSVAMSDTATVVDYAAFGSELLDDLAGLMNTEVAGDYVFGGTVSKIKPVDTANLSTTPSVAAPDTAYYEGSSSLASVQVSMDVTVTYGVNAGDTSDGFEKALRAANLLKHTTPLTASAISAIYDLTVAAIDELTSTQAGLSLTASRLTSAKTLQDNAATLLTNQVSSLKDVDTAAAAVKVTNLQTTLQSSYSALAKVTKLSLTNYL
ncbi:flagellin [Phaeospirillum tilakii]|uniref:Flagellin n=1 Tax=Phaeospirillum tilakii TaxID=741673 RepID=A0ABW5CD18_9PROT